MLRDTSFFPSGEKATPVISLPFSCAVSELLSGRARLDALFHTWIAPSRQPGVSYECYIIAYRQQ